MFDSHPARSLDSSAAWRSGKDWSGQPLWRWPGLQCLGQLSCRRPQSRESVSAHASLHPHGIMHLSLSSGQTRAFAQAQVHLHQCWWSAGPRTGQRPAWCNCPGVGAGGCLCQGDWQGRICWHPDCDAEHFWAPHRHAEMWKMVAHAKNIWPSGQNILPGTHRQPNAWTFVFATPLHKISHWRLRECFPQRQRTVG